MTTRETRSSTAEARETARRHEAVAAGAASWDELAEVVRGCTACAELAASRTHVVVGDAPRGARLLLVGEAPGAQEDESGRPFVGRSGQLLDEALVEAGLTRAEVAVANVLKCRPPANRTPRRPEVVRCRPWLARQIALVDPAVVVTLGSVAAAEVFGPGARIGELRGREHEVDGRITLATYHPSAALRFGPRGAPALGLREDLGIAAAALVRVRDSSRPSATG